MGVRPAVHFRSLASRFVLLILLSSIPAIIYMLISAKQMRETRADDARSDVQRITRVLASYQTSLLQSTGDLLATLSHSPSIKGRHWDLCQQFLREVIAVNSYYANVGVADLDGRIVCSGAPISVGVNVADRSYFRRALTATGYEIGDFHVGRITGHNSLGVAYPIRDAQGKTAGVIFAAVKVEALAPPLDEVPFHSHSIAKIFDVDGVLLATIPRDDRRSGQAVDPPQLYAATRRQRDGTLSLAIDGKEWLYAFAGIGPREESSRIVVALGAPVTELLLESERRYWRELIGVILILAGVIAIGWLLGYTLILQQLRLLTAAARRMADGDFNARAALPPSQGELTELGNSLDLMASRVQAQIAQLEALGVALEERNQVLRMIVQGVRLESIMADLASMVEMQIPGSIGSVFRLDEKGGWRHLAGPHLPHAVVAALQTRSADIGAGPLSAVIRRGEAVIAADIANDARWRELHGLMRDHQINACWAHPIVASGGRVLGIFALYFPEARAPSDDELTLLDVAHHIAAVAIESNDLRRSLEQAAACYGYLFEHNPNPMWVFDIETLCFLAVNAAAVNHYGFSREEFLQMTLRAVIPAEDSAEFETRVMALIREPRTSFYTQLRHRRKAGDIIAVDITSVRIEFATRPARLSVIHDITDAERAQHNLAERERLLHLLLQSTNEGIFGVDALGRITFANRACADVLGYESPDELVGLSAHQTVLHSPRDSSGCDGSDCALYRAMRAEQPNHADNLFFWRRDGLPVPVEFWYYPAVREGAADGAIVTFLDITERHAQREALTWQATHDALTGLSNRVVLQTALRKVIDDSAAARETFALLVIDLDQFKEINDTLGHAAGDQLLSVLGPRLRAAVDADETVVRLGGDEFAIVLRPGTRRHAVEETALRLLRVIEEPVDIAGTRIQAGASIGAAFYPDDGQSAEELLRCADVAMYHAKQNYHRYATYAALFDNQQLERLALKSDLRMAIASQQLCLHFQPKIDIASGAVIGFESLVRWLHSACGLIAPGEFLPWIERSDLIHPFTAWVMEAAISQSRSWRDTQASDACISVNVFAGNLLDTSLPERIETLLRRYDVAAGQIELEITESSLMANPMRSLEVVGALRKLGLRVSIDDFGTGYSSLAYLQQLPVNCVKIDRAFIRSLPTDKSSRLIVSAIIDLSHKLSLEVIAEGVEDRPALDVLRELNCDQAQGFYVARPMPPAQALQWLQDRSRR